MPAKSEIAAAARALMRRAFKGSLATIEARNGYPYASLITLATDASGAPAFLISKLARHTANLASARRAYHATNSDDNFIPLIEPHTPHKVTPTSEQAAIDFLAHHLKP